MGNFFFFSYSFSSGYSYRRALSFFFVLTLALSACGKKDDDVFGVATTPIDPPRLTGFAKLEAELLAGLNSVRTNPKDSVAALESILARFDEAGVLTNLDGQRVQTNEGRPAVEEAIEALKNAVPVKALKRNALLDKAARDHQKDQEATGEVGHKGSDGNFHDVRIAKYAKSNRSGENIAYGFYGDKTGFWVNFALYIDDGVADRGHRTNMMDGNWEEVGIACGKHPVYGVECVVNMARGVSKL